MTEDEDQTFSSSIIPLHSAKTANRFKRWSWWNSKSPTGQIFTTKIQ
jgi:hypothetical protein